MSCAHMYARAKTHARAPNLGYILIDFGDFQVLKSIEDQYLNKINNLFNKYDLSNRLNNVLLWNKTSEKTILIILLLRFKNLRK